MKLVDPPTILPKKLLKNVQRTKRFAFDFEARSKTGKSSDATSATRAEPTILAISSGSFNHAYLWGDDAQAIIIYLLSQPGLEAIVCNALYDFVLMHSNGIMDVNDVKATIRDTMVQQFLLDENLPKGLKGCVADHLGHKMATYNETTKDNPKNLRIKQLLGEIKEWRKAIKRFETVRPWPEFDSKKLGRRTKLRKSVDAAADKQWPPIISTSAKGNTTKRWQKGPKEERAEWRQHRHELIEDKFSFGEQLGYQAYVEDAHINPRLAEIEDLRIGLVQDELEYAEDDGRQTLRLYDRMEKKLGRLGQLVMDWYEIESQVRVVTLKMSCNGIHIDKEEATAQLVAIEPIIEELYGDVQNHCRGWTNDDGVPFNPGSSQQVVKVLFDHLGLPLPVYRYVNGTPVPKLTPAGDKYCRDNRTLFGLNDLDSLPSIFWEKFVSVDSEVLERVHHPIGMAILNYRVAKKLKSTYLQNLVELKTDRLYGSFNSVGPKTGRLSSADPNLQNIPSRKKPSNYDERVQGIGPILRRCYIAPPGKKMIVCDQSQIELRIITHFTQDRRLLKIYRDHVVIGGNKYYIGDIHAATSKDLGVKRKDAKGINFGLSYEMQAPKFARMNRMFNDDGSYDIATAAEWRNGFFDVNAGLTAYLQMLSNCWENGKSDYQMLSGRLRRFPRKDVKGKPIFTTGGKILNSKVQGSSADLLKLAMLVIDKYIIPQIPSLKMIFQVHDELGFEVDEEHAEVAGILIKHVMEFDWLNCLSVPVLSSAKVCDNWEAKDDDNLPEIGVFYARVDGEDRLFDSDTWAELVTADNEHRIEVKSAAAMLTPAQLELCAQYVPKDIHEEPPVMVA